MSNDTFVSGFGQFHTNEEGKSNRRKYNNITMAAISGMVDLPPSVEKSESQWFIPSTLPSRVFSAQAAGGEYWALWADLDKDPKPLDEVASAVEILAPGANFEIYTTRSAQQNKQKARIILPLQTALTGDDWHLFQQVFNDRLEAAEITPDRASEGYAQLCYLPNRGEFYDSRTKRNGTHFAPLTEWTEAIAAKQLSIERAAKEAKTRMEAAQLKREQRASIPDDGKVKPIDAFNAAFMVEEILLSNGYAQRGSDFRHPASESGNYSASVRDGRVYSLSPSDPLYTRDQSNGSHDAFSAYAVLEHGGDTTSAIKEAAALLGRDSFSEDEHADTFEKSTANKTRHTRHSQHTQGGKSSRNPSQASNDPSRMGQNEMATAIGEVLGDVLGYNSQSSGWYGRDKDIWQPIPVPRARSKVEDQIAKLKPAFSAGYLSSVLKFLESRLAMPVWESDRNLLPMINGVLNLSTGDLSDYDNRVFNWQIPHTHNAKATCPTIERWLHTVTGGADELKAFLMAWMRAVLTGGAHLQKYVEIVGPGGTGKSTFIRLCRLLVGESNSVSTDLKTLEASRFESAGLYGKRLAIVSDSARYGGEVATLKAITGGDPLRFEQKNIQAGESFVFAGVVMIAANEPIQSADYTSGLARRRIPLFFNRKVTEAEKLATPDFEERLSAEIPGLLNLLLRIRSDEADNTIRNPGQSLARSKLEAELETNPLLVWMHERLLQCGKGEETAIGTLKTSGLYSDYAYYCDEHGREPVSTTRFSRLVVDNATSRGIRTDKWRVPGSGVHVVKNLRLRKLHDPATMLFSVTASNSGVTTSSPGSADCDGCDGFSTTSEFATVEVEV